MIHKSRYGTYAQLEEIIGLLSEVVDNTGKPIVTATQKQEQEEITKRMNTPHSELPYDWD